MIMSDMRGGSSEGLSGEDLEGEQLFAMKVNNKVRQLKSKLILHCTANGSQALLLDWIFV